MQPNSRIPVWLPRKLHQRLKVRCAQLGIEIQEAAVKAVDRWLSSPENKKQSQ